jgi:hypothetical protein
MLSVINYAECRVLYIILNVIMPSVVMLYVMLSVVLLSVVVPIGALEPELKLQIMDKL